MTQELERALFPTIKSLNREAMRQIQQAMGKAAEAHPKSTIYSTDPVIVAYTKQGAFEASSYDWGLGSLQDVLNVAVNSSDSGSVWLSGTIMDRGKRGYPVGQWALEVWNAQAEASEPGVVYTVRLYGSDQVRVESIKLRRGWQIAEMKTGDAGAAVTCEKGHLLASEVFQTPAKAVCRAWQIKENLIARAEAELDRVRGLEVVT